MTCGASPRSLPPFDAAGLSIEQCALDVLRHPTVASKSFLVTIGDRTVGGMNSRDPMVGPWQVPVADCAVTMMSFDGYAGEAMAIGERTPLAVIDAAAASRMAIGEAITNIAAADVELVDVKLSCNWMAACGQPGEDAKLFDAVQRGERIVPAARNQRAGRQGFLVDEDGLARRRRRTSSSPRRCR